MIWHVCVCVCEQRLGKSVSVQAAKGSGPQPHSVIDLLRSSLKIAFNESMMNQGTSDSVGVAASRLCLQLVKSLLSKVSGCE